MDTSLSQTPRISVIMPVYNGEAYLRNALDSLVHQTLPHDQFEVIALDDGSKDASERILRSYAQQLPLHILSGAHAGNWVATTNLGLKAARGTYMTFLHQDDLYEPDRLARLVACIEEQTTPVRVLAHPVDYLSSKGARVGRWSPPFHKGLCEPSYTVPRLLVQNNLSVPGVLFHRDCVALYGALDETLRYTADWDFWLRLLSHEPCFYLSTPLSAFRIHGASQTVSFAAHQTEYEENLRIVVERYAALVSPQYHRMAAFGVSLNLLLAALGTNVHPRPWKPVWRTGLRLSPVAFMRYLNLSRVFPRTFTRLRVRL